VTLDEIARRIGFQPGPHGDDWWDVENASQHHPVSAANLRRYLLTGDRPLRILAALGAFCPDVELWLLEPGVWRINVTNGQNGGAREGQGYSPEEAILAAAEALPPQETP
jgi:hypothetical protein